MHSSDDVGLLSPYRVVDLTDERGILCSKILADLGADVIQVEPPGGAQHDGSGPSITTRPIPNGVCFGGHMPPTNAVSP